MFSPRPQASTPTSQGRFVFRAGPAMSCEASGPNQAGIGSLRVGGKLFDRVSIVRGLVSTRRGSEVCNGPK